MFLVIFNLRNCKRKSANFDIVSIFHLLTLGNHGLDFFIQCLVLKHSVFVGFFYLICLTSFLQRNPDSPRLVQVTVIKFCIQGHLSSKREVWFLPPRWLLKNFCLMWKIWFLNYHSRFCIGIFKVQKCENSF